MSESAFPKLTEYTPPLGLLKVLREGAAFLCVEKPAGLLSVPGKEPHLSDCLEARVKARYPEALLIHRLDMDTSGVMVFARTKAAQRDLGRQFERRDVSKTYAAVVDGVIAADQGEIDLPIVTDWPNRPLQKVCFAHGRPAKTRWQVRARATSTTHLNLIPVTGRSHQLRLHMKEIGHPICGDRFYGHGDGAPRLMLHAVSLRFFDPNTRDPVDVVSTPSFF
ncbi:MAG: pseudouridine synthase [Pseudomonadota bacterium]